MLYAMRGNCSRHLDAKSSSMHVAIGEEGYYHIPSRSLVVKGGGLNAFSVDGMLVEFGATRLVLAM